MTCVRQPQCLSFLLGQVLVCTQYSLLYVFRLFIHDVQFFLVVWYAIVYFLSLYMRPLYASASMPSFFYARPLSASASVPSLLHPQYALASQPPPLASAARCRSTFISFFYDSNIYF
ncbi:uncharacterized protein EI90DRAFT_3034638 [Cantharellus anzutake]|uniref:uncharacterized protein n=1 Tax=Cantharellus anzutake TaxID=1750568 RepID=UPI001906991D|nr:uncharacterized protein EI90DRAFT_3034638 [Cantharellus anzutake]KAF8341619.1 hypothetical protein EI90DRAFT_3034638 [Cantharellus anzutake]